MNPIQAAAERFLARGWGVVRIPRGEKLPVQKQWNRRSARAVDFAPTDNIGILYGRLSGDLVCVDIDSAEVLAVADQCLPETRCVEGRPGKPRSHRLYRVVNIPQGLVAPRQCAGGIGGPATKRFRCPEGKSLVEIIGTGQQAVAPPSVWRSRDGKLAEGRCWDEDGEPATVDCLMLYRSIAEVAARFGYGGTIDFPARARPARNQRKSEESRPDWDVGACDRPTDAISRQARSYVASIPPAVSGCGGGVQTYKVAHALVAGFDMTPAEALPLLLEYNLRCLPPWTEEELLRRLEYANQTDVPRGYLGAKPTDTVTIDVAPGDNEIRIGVGCRTGAGSVVLLEPCLWSALYRLKKQTFLVPELDGIDWEGKSVTVVPASNIRTNARQVWGEYHLARLLRERGAAVRSTRLPYQHRLRTLDDLGDESLLLESFEVPETVLGAKLVAREANALARESDPVRKKLPRQSKPKFRPKLEVAVRYLRETGQDGLTKAVIAWGAENGIGRQTMAKAVRFFRENPADQTEDGACQNASESE